MRDLDAADYAIVFVNDVGDIGGIGALEDDRVTLNYVDPNLTGCGMSRALMDDLERHAASIGIEIMQLVSTASARHFYYKRGYREWTLPQRGNGLSWNHPMTKNLRITHECSVVSSLQRDS